MRIATEEDSLTVLGMAEKFVATTGYGPLFDKATVGELILAFIKAAPTEKIIILDDFGFIAGQATQFPFGPYRMASEVAWWIDPDSRGENKGSKLMEAFEYWAKEVALCDFISMTSLDKKVENIYKKKGYKLYERAYMRVL